VDVILPDGEPVVKRRLLLRRVQGLLVVVGDEGDACTTNVAHSAS
jgi:hypothetical protein